MRYVSGRDERGRAIGVRAPLAQELAEAFAAGTGDARKIVDAFLGPEAVFGRDLAPQAPFRLALGNVLALILEHGTAAAARATLARITP